MRLPRALATAQQYAQHVSPFASIEPPQHQPQPGVNPQSESATQVALIQARDRIKVLSNERSYYQQALRRATNVDPNTGKTTLETLESQNANLRRVNTTQTNTNKKLKAELATERKKYLDLANLYNRMLLDFHKSQEENAQMKAQLGQA